MRQVTEIRGQRSGAVWVCLLMACVFLASPLRADSKDESLRPLDSASESVDAANEPVSDQATDPALEKKYRTELEKRLDQERASYTASLRSLWLANVAVWGCLIAFIIFQAVSARKRAAELDRLKQQREES